MKKFKTVEEWIEFWNDFTLWGKAEQMSNYYYNKLDKAGELGSRDKEPVYKKKNEILRDMFYDWETVISEIDWDIHLLNIWTETEEEKLDYLNEMLKRYEWYLQW